MNTAILFDTMSIQQYVFGSNKLKDNLGASYIVENIYEFLDKKSKLPDPLLTKGYIGGGNALFFTSSEEKAKEIVKEFTTFLLLNYPGVNISVAIKEEFINQTDDYPEGIKKLFRILAENKGKYIPVNTISSHGITATCPFSSMSVEDIIVNDENGKKSYELVSSITKSKRNFKQEINNDGKDILNRVRLAKYQFVDELDKLGQKRNEDSHIAVVHIDGNGFGNHFKGKESVEEARELSQKVKNAVKNAFIDSLINYSIIEESIKHLIDSYNYDNNILPIRPIILGGDDVTFVCHGKLGIWFAENFMKEFNSNFIDKEQTIPFSSCAGVAVVKTKYPFYRAYQLAEELCGNAKKMNKEHGGNWIDFQLAYSGLGNTLEEVRSLQYNNVAGFNRPYQIGDTESEYSFGRLKCLSDKLKSALPNSKIKDLREMLTKKESSLNNFFEHLKLQHEDFKRDFTSNNSTEIDTERNPFFDMIELIELYPTNLLNE